MRDQPHLKNASEKKRKEVASLSTELSALRARQAELGALIEAVDWQMKQQKAGNREAVRSHIQTHTTS